MTEMRGPTPHYILVDEMADFLRGYSPPDKPYVRDRQGAWRKYLSTKTMRMSNLLNPLRPAEQARFDQMFPGMGVPAPVKPRQSARRRAWR